MRLKKLVACVPKIVGGAPQADVQINPVVEPRNAQFSSIINSTPIKDQIMKRMTPGEAKFGERVGSKWADAVKSFLALQPNMTSRQLIQLVRLERAANPHHIRQWYPSFGGVWNETTRANHARTFFASQRDRRTTK